MAKDDDKEKSVENYTNCKNYTKCSSNESQQDDTAKTVETKKLTLEIVEKVTHELRAQGIEPTFTNVREQLSYGSNSTIIKYLNIINLNKLNQESQFKIYDIDKSEIEILAHKIVNIAFEGNLIAARKQVELNTARFNEYQKMYNTNIEQLVKQNEELIAEKALLSAELETCRADVKAKNNRIEELLNSNSSKELKDQLDKLTKQNKTLQDKLLEVINKISEK